MDTIKVLSKIFNTDARNVPVITGVSVDNLKTLTSIPSESVDPLLGVSDFTVGKFCSTEKSVYRASHEKYYQGNIQYWKGVLESDYAKQFA